MNSLLQNEIQFLPGVGPKRAELLLKELDIKTYEDLLYHFPYKYIDRSKFYPISEINSDQFYIQTRGRIVRVELMGQPPRQRLVARLYDNTGSIELIWFRGIKFIRQSLKANTEYIVFGKPAFYGGDFSMPHPEIELAEKVEQFLYPYAFQAAYPTTERMKNGFLNSKAIQKLQYQLLQKLQGQIPETLPEELIQKLRLPSLNEALLQVHFPRDQEHLRKARYRLKFEELFFIQLGLLRQKNWRTHQFRGHPFEKVGDRFHQFYKENLPFELTGAQKRVIREIRIDLGSGKQMNRLLQGDVGSGKTLVALLNILIAIDNGYQACLMAPTEILAQQHFATFTKMLEGMPVEVRLLTGSTRKRERTLLHEVLREGSLHILVGTHALLEEVVQFNNLGLVIIDEQHRFGVAQRARLWEKTDGIPPHILIMTATPIPRTLAMTLYGDLDISVIDELPPGRKPIQTLHFYDSKRLRLFTFIRDQISAGRQVYIVYPLIQESETLDYKDLFDGYESVSRAFPPPEYAVSVLHGRMKPEEKVKSMEFFVKGTTQIMVATTVIEVGVDVQNASVMVIESAERFGLSQLHQLRGRVGRGADQSYCVLMTGVKLSKEARTRIETMVRTTDGFEIAEVDMKLRGPGNMEGTQQSGIPFSLHIANLAKDGRILELARRMAADILADDPLLADPSNQMLVRKLHSMKTTLGDWSRIS